MSSLAQLGSWSHSLMPCSEGHRASLTQSGLTLPWGRDSFCSFMLLEQEALLTEMPQPFGSNRSSKERSRTSHAPECGHKQSPEQERLDRQNLGGAWQDDLSVVVGSRLRTLPIVAHLQYVKRRADFKFWSRREEISGHEEGAMKTVEQQDGRSLGLTL